MPFRGGNVLDYYWYHPHLKNNTEMIKFSPNVYAALEPHLNAEPKSKHYSIESSQSHFLPIETIKKEMRGREVVEMKMMNLSQTSAHSESTLVLGFICLPVHETNLYTDMLYPDLICLFSCLNLSSWIVSINTWGKTTEWTLNPQNSTQGFHHFDILLASVDTVAQCQNVNCPPLSLMIRAEPWGHL